MANNKVKIVVGFPANGGGNEVDQQIDGGNA